MKTSLIVLTGLSGLALTIAGCGGVVQQSNKAQRSQIIPTTTTVKTEDPAEETTTEEVETLAVESTQAASLAEIPQPVNELAEAKYAWNQLLARDAILPIYEPEFAPAKDAPYADDELVIGVEINGEAKAYAIGPLNSRRWSTIPLAVGPYWSPGDRFAIPAWFMTGASMEKHLSLATREDCL